MSHQDTPDITSSPPTIHRITIRDSQRPLRIHSQSPNTQQMSRTNQSSSGTLIQTLFHPQIQSHSAQSGVPQPSTMAIRIAQSAPHRATANATSVSTSTSASATNALSFYTSSAHYQRTLAATAAQARNLALRPQFRGKIVCEISCRHCDVTVCKRGMKAILLADTNVRIYSMYFIIIIIIILLV